MAPKKQNKVPFREEDAAALLQRYDASTVLRLLQELANYPHSKFDWNELVAKTSTGISDAREYQMLWRHLAYGHSFAQNLDHNDAQPMDDDSDLECEREVFPRVNLETAAEASACAQVMIESFKLSESTPTSSVIEAPLSINVPVLDSSTVSEEMIAFPVTVKRQALSNIPPTRAVEISGGPANGNTSTKKKRTAWSEEEDMQLRAAVKRWGEGNWANMTRRDDFPIKRSTSQLCKVLLSPTVLGNLMIPEMEHIKKERGRQQLIIDKTSEKLVI